MISARLSLVLLALTACADNDPNLIQTSNDRTWRDPATGLSGRSAPATPSSLGPMAWPTAQP